MYEPRTYREWVKTDDLVTYRVVSQETDLLISSDKPFIREAQEAVEAYRNDIIGYINANACFAELMEPLGDDPAAPPIIRDMLLASSKAGVGPMAGIAGAVAGYVGAGLRSRSNEVIVENGGDIFIFSRKERCLGVYAGDSPLSGKVALKVGPCDEPLGICTSSGTVGHSKSFGRADAALVISPDIILADCAATAVGNCVNSEDDLDAAIGFAKSVPGITGALIIIGARMAVWGDVQLV